jgi:ADP-ribose pyrophosphatase YjhB (NUDIX family)
VANIEPVTVARRSARAILIDEDGRLVLIRRTKLGQSPYWTTAGGGVERDDPSVEAAMHRELFEELGAKAAGASQVFLVSSPSEAGLRIQHFFVTRLLTLDLAARTGPEFADPARGAYDPDYFDLRGDALAAVDLQPPELKAFILANRAALLAEAGRTSEHETPDRLTLPADPGLCGTCRHASVKGTNRGTAYLRCTRASWDDRLAKYPRLPVATCPGFAS